MPITEAGLLTVPVVALERLVAASSTFRTLVGAGTEDAAKASIHFEEVHDELDADAPDFETVERNPKPRAVICMADFGTMRQGPGSWRDPGQLYLAFEFPIPAEHLFAEVGNYKEEFKYFANLVGQIIAEMRDASGTHDAQSKPRLNASQIELLYMAPCDPDDSHGYYWGAQLRVGWPN